MKTFTLFTLASFSFCVLTAQISSAQEAPTTPPPHHEITEAMADHLFQKNDDQPSLCDYGLMSSTMSMFGPDGENSDPGYRLNKAVAKLIVSLCRPLSVEFKKPYMAEVELKYDFCDAGKAQKTIADSQAEIAAIVKLDSTALDSDLVKLANTLIPEIVPTTEKVCKTIATETQTPPATPQKP